VTTVPGMGGVGDGSSFKQNIEALKKYKIKTKVIHDVENPDMSVEILGKKIDFPVMVAPITGTSTNLGGSIDELSYNLAVVEGAVNSNSFSFVGDGASPEKYKVGLEAISKFNGDGIPIFKPRKDNSEIIKRIKAAEKVGARAVGIDIDAIIFKTMISKRQEVSSKSVSDLKKIIASTKLPFVLKGIMCVEDAENAVKIGASCIVVSNHGGRVLEGMAGSMDVLEEIVEAVGGKITILVDGGFRDGTDVFKALALGANGVLIGRPIVMAAVGMGKQGVSFYLDKIKAELSKTMLLTGCKKITDIKKDRLVK